MSPQFNSPLRWSRSRSHCSSALPLQIQCYFDRLTSFWTVFELFEGKFDIIKNSVNLFLIEGKNIASNFETEIYDLVGARFLTKTYVENNNLILYGDETLLVPISPGEEKEIDLLISENDTIGVLEEYSYSDYEFSFIASKDEQDKGKKIISTIPFSYIFDLETPSAFKLIGQFDSGGTVWGSWVENDIAYIADYSKGLLIVDISDPNNPVLLESHFDGGAGQDVVVSGGYIYFADRHDGLEILQYT